MYVLLAMVFLVAVLLWSAWTVAKTERLIHYK